ncbi:MAG: hypothetical protein QOG99_2435 [Frankiales bacterium]|nr:hypothetical protein [Frankiales bacterium]
MTQTVERPRLSRPTPPSRSPSADVLLPGVSAAAWALGAGLVLLGLPVLLAWAADSRSGSGAGAALRTVGQLWLVAHGVGLTLAAGPVHLTPLGLAAVPLLLLHRAGRHAARTSAVGRGRDAGLLVLAMATPYALTAAVLAVLAGSPAVRPSTAGALLLGFAVAVVGAASGVVREAGLLAGLDRLPGRTSALLRATAIATAALVAGGALVAGATVALHPGRVTSLADATDPGLLGGLGLLLLGLSLVPNAAIWGTSWVTGPGFAVGAGTAVSPWSSTLGPVPAFPLLGGLPSGPAPTWLGVAALAVPLVAGVLGGLVVARALGAVSLTRAALEGAVVAPCVAVLLTLLALVSGGPLGDGRLSAIGPSPWRVGVAVLAEVLLPSVAAAVLGVRRARP